MTRTSSPEILLVRNGRSRAARDASVRARAVLAAGGYTGLFVDAPTARELTLELTRQLRARASRVAAVVAVGGDGMVHGVLQVVHRLSREGVDVAFGVIPAGSGNDLARFFGLPTRDVERAAGRVLRGLETPARFMDLLSVTCADGSDHVCATTVCLGVDARVNALANRWSRVRLPAKYVLALLAELSRLHALPYALELTHPDGTRRRTTRTATFLSLANTSSYGGGLTFAPHADPCDGRAELFSVSDVGPLRLLTLLPRLLTRTHESLAQVDLEPVTDVTVTPLLDGAHPADIAHGDGEALGPLPVHVRVLPSAVRVLF